MKVKRNTTNHNATTLDGYFQAFLMMKKIEGKSKSTLENYFIAFERYKVINGFGDHTEMPDACQRSTVYAMILQLQTEGKPATSINHYIKQLRVFLNFLMKEGVLEKYDIPTIEEQDNGVKYYSDADIERLLKKPTNLNDFVEVRTWVMLNLACACGARISSINSLRVEDIDFDRYLIHFPHTKNKRYLQVPLSTTLAPILRKYITEWRGGPPDAWLFPSVENGELTVNGARKALVRYCKERGVKRASWHSCRHSYARHFVLSGGQAFQLAGILGHNSLEPTKRYVKLFGEDLKVGFDDMNLLNHASKTAVGGHTKYIKRKND